MADVNQTFSIDTTMTISDPDHLHVRCANWPKWYRGKVADRGFLTENWGRVDTSAETPARPENPFSPPQP